MRGSGFLLFAIMLVCGTAASAADTPDKSSYTLFNPVPDSQLRAFATDRPTKSNSPITVDAGHYLYEGDLLNWIYDRDSAGDVTTSNFSLFAPTLKAGLTNNIDFEVALAPLNINHATDRATGDITRANGFGDVTLRTKFNLWGNDGGDTAFAIVPYVKVPTAKRSLGNGEWEGGAYAPLTITLPQEWTLLLMTEVDVLQNAATNGVHPNYQNLANISHAVPGLDGVTGYAEFWSGVNTDTGAETQYTADFAAAWLVKDNLQLDIGVNIGLNQAANDVQPYFGIAQRF